MLSLKNRAYHLLSSSTRILNLDMVYLAKGSLWQSLSFGIGTIASVVTMIAFGNLLPRETYGTYNYLLSLGASLSFLSLSGAGLAVMRAVARGHENVTPVALRLHLKYNLIATTTVLSAAIYYSFKGNMLFAGSLAMLAFAYPIAEAFHIYKQVLTGRKRFDILAKITSITTLVATATTVIALFLTDNILHIIAIYTFMSLVPNIIAYKWTARHLDKAVPDPEQVAQMRRTAFHMTGAGVIGVIASYIDKIILFQVAGPVVLAVYGFAIAGPDRLKSLVKNWMSIASPKLAQKSLGQIRLVLYRRIGFSVILGSVLFIIYFFLAPLLFKLFLPQYLDAIPYSQVQAISLVIAPASIFVGAVFASQNMLRATYALNIGSHIARILLFLIFGWLWQIWGLIAASIISHVANTILSLIIWEVEVRRLINKNEQ